MSLYNLTYVSSASGCYDKDIYRQIAKDSACFNKVHNITGLLLVYNESIIQFLEGAKADIEALYGRIEIDQRHKSPLVISRREINHREFPNWSMGYQEIVSGSEQAYLFELSLNSLQAKTPESISTVTQSLLTSYKRSSGLEVLA